MRKGVAFLVAGLAVAFVLAVLVSPLASSHPDGLESSVLKSACDGAADADACLAEREGGSRWGGAPLPDYGGDAGPGRAGLLGVAATFLVGYCLVVLVRARRERARADAGDAEQRDAEQRDAEQRDAEQRDGAPPRDRVG